MHLARTAGRGGIASRAQADRDIVNTRQVNTLIGKALQRDRPFRPAPDPRRADVGVDYYGKGASGYGVRLLNRMVQDAYEG